MGTLKITDFVLYRWRYILSYIAIAVLLGVILYATGLFAPGGLSGEEMASTVRTGQLDMTALYGQQPEQLVHLPYQLLQTASIGVFGFDTLALKLPSLILAGIAAIGFYGLLSLWFKRNTAVIATVILITSGQFLLQSQQATPAVAYLFWGVGLLFATSMLARAERFRPIWLIVASIIGALSLYTPLQVYVIIALLITSIVHPHARFIVFKQPAWAIITSLVLFIGLSMPLVLGFINDPTLGLRLLGIPKDLGSITMAGIMAQLSQFVSFYRTSTDTQMTPPYSLGIALLFLIGLYRLLSAKYTAKSYILTLWAAFIIPLVALNPDAITFTLLPIMVFVAFAIDYLIRSWYQLFPRNPYARFAGLLPLAVLLVGLSFSTMERFVYGYHYDPSASSVYRDDLSLVEEAADRYADDELTLLVPDNQRDFFSEYASHTDRGMAVTSSLSEVASGTTLLALAGSQRDQLTATPTFIAASGNNRDADRLYVYENTFR